ncbi:hypothetical protein ACFC1R_01590 [Kitasatospora sp. NPDC056138]|uniref:hypothetical protein n=1 Tax=Kitasatospora sp. NPDC056138 TaxID=3345724 RepID=UPI0035D5405A
MTSVILAGATVLLSVAPAHAVDVIWTRATVGTHQPAPVSGTNHAALAQSPAADVIWT